MAILGWLFLLVASLGFTFASFGVIVVGSKFSGKVDGESLFVLIPTVLFWYLTIANMPFSITLN